MPSDQLLGGRYRLVELLGHGGMSAVWRGYDQALGRSVAVKLLTAGYAADAASRARIRAEGRTAARLSHPHICRVYDYGESQAESGETVPYLVMELLPGMTLGDQLYAGPMPVRAALRMCAQVASALAAAHRRGLVHRDIKPGNIMLTAAGPKVVDFGIAAAAGEPGEPREDGEVWGTPAYVAPERLTGGEVQSASDVYALGLVLYRALAGTAPWPAETVPEILHAHAYEPPAPLPERDGLPPAVADLCQRCLAKDPAVRPTATDVAQELAQAGGWRLSTVVEGILLDTYRSEDELLALPAAARRPGDRAKFARAVLAGSGIGRRRWPDPPRPAAPAAARSRTAAPSPRSDSHRHPATASSGRRQGQHGRLGPDSLPHPPPRPAPHRPRRRTSPYPPVQLGAAAAVATLAAVTAAMFIGGLLPGDSGDRYLGLTLGGAPAVAGVGPAPAAGPAVPTPSDDESDQAPPQLPSPPPGAPPDFGGGGGAPPAPPVPQPSGSSGGPSGGSPSGPGPTTLGSGTTPTSAPTTDPPPPPPTTDPPSPPPTVADSPENTDSDLGSTITDLLDTIL